MSNKNDQSINGFGLLANGVAGRWSIAVDESLDRDEWWLEIEGPQVYLVFQLDDLTIPLKALQFLQSGLETQQTQKDRERPGSEDTLVVGRFGPASVSLLMDNESFPRSFLVVGPRARSTMRVSFDAEDMQQLSEALRQVVEDLPEPAGA